MGLALEGAAPRGRPTDSANAKDYFRKRTALASTDAPQTNHELQTVSVLRRLPYAKVKADVREAMVQLAAWNDADRQAVDRPLVDQSLRPRSMKQVESR